MASLKDRPRVFIQKSMALPRGFERLKEEGGSGVAIGALRDQCLDDLDDLVLLAAGQFGDLVEDLTEFAAGGDRPAWLRFAEQIMDGDADVRWTRLIG